MAERAAADGWAMQLYERSVLKQQKYRALRDMLGSVQGKRCLDIGGDNGVISYLLRQLGGEWHSADLDVRTVEAIRGLVGDRVVRIRDGRLPHPDDHFDLVAIVDLLEHLEDDRSFVEECARLLRPGGTLIVNVPHIKRFSLLRKLRLAVGLTDERHGHVRPGYTLETLEEMLASHFSIQEVRTYCGSCSELIDIALNAAYEWRNSTPDSERSRKGTVITESDWSEEESGQALLGLAYPVLKLFSAGDALLAWQSGYRLIVRAARRMNTTQTATAHESASTGA